MVSMQKLGKTLGGLRLMGRSRLLASLALAICLLALPLGAQANDTWGAAGTGVYLLPANWAGGTVPNAAGQLANFAAGAQTPVLINGLGVTAGSFAFTAAAPVYTYTVTAPLAFTGGGGVVITAGSGTPVFNVGVGGSITFNAGDTGAATYNIGAGASNGTLTFNGASTATNAAINNTSTAATGVDFSGHVGAITVGSLTGNGTINLGANAVTINAGTNISGVITGAAGSSIIKDTAGSLTLSGNNAPTYAGTTTLKLGTLIGATNTAFGTGPLALNGGILAGSGGLRTWTNNVTVGGIATIGGANDVTLTGTVNLTNQLLTVTNGAATIISNAISSTGAGNGITLNAPGGSLTLGGVNTYNGPTTILVGTLQAGSATGLSPNSAVTLNNGAGVTLDLNGFNPTILTLAGGGGAGGIVTNTAAPAATLFTGDNATNTNFNGNIVDGLGTVALAKQGTDIFTLSGNNTYSGATAILAGTLQAGSATGLSPNSAVTLNNGAGVTLDLNGLNSTILTLAGGGGAGGIVTNTAAGAATLTTGSFFNTNFFGNIVDGAGTVALTKQGTGIFTLSGTNTYSGATLINVGTLQAGSATGLSPNSAVTLNNAGGVTLDLNGFNSTIGSLAGGGLAGGIVTDSVAAANTLTTGGNGTSTNFSGVIQNGAGTVSLTKVGGGVQTLAGTNTYTGATTINAGTILAGSGQPLGVNSAVTVAAPGTLDLGGNSFAIGSLAGAGLVTDSVAAANTLTTGGNGTSTNFSGVIQDGIGVVSLTKVGGGTLTLTGANLYTGATNINAGVLNLNGIGSLATLAVNGVNINAGTTFNLNSTNAASLVANSVLMFGASTFNMGPGSLYNAPLGFNVPAAGTVNLAATSNIFVGLGPVLGFNNAGFTTLNGTVTGDFNNAATGFLRGNGGTITGNLNNAGIVRPGLSPGIINVGGNYNPTAAGITAIEVASGAGPGVGYSRLAVAGNSNLNGTLRPLLTGGFIPTFNQVFTGVVTTGGVQAGQFTSIDNQQITRTLFWRAIYNANSVDLQAEADFTFPNLDLGLTPNQLSVANMLNRVSNVTSGDLFDVLSAITLLPSNGAIVGALNEISAMKYYYLPTMTFGLTRMQFEGFKSRMARLRWESELSSGSPSAGGSGGGSGGGLFRGLNFGGDNRMLLASSTIAVSDAGNPMVRSGVDQRWGIYVEPLFNWGNQGGVPNQVGYRAFSAGFTAGVDFRITQNLLVGLNAGYSNTDTTIGGTGGNININTIPFNAYGAFSMNGFYVDGIIGYTHNNYDMERNIVFGTINRTATANTSGNQFQLGADGGYDIKAGNAIFGPMLSLQYATLGTDGFTESNAGALNLKVSSQSASSVQTGLGARASYRVKVGDVTVKPQVSVAWQHEYSDNTRGLNASLATVGNSNMTFRTVSNPGKDFAVVGAEVSARFSKRFVANVGYTGELGRSNSSNHMLNAGIRFEF